MFSLSFNKKEHLSLDTPHNIYAYTCLSNFHFAIVRDYNLTQCLPSLDDNLIQLLHNIICKKCLPTLNTFQARHIFHHNNTVIECYNMSGSTIFCFLAMAKHTHKNYLLVLKSYKNFFSTGIISCYNKHISAIIYSHNMNHPIIQRAMSKYQTT